MADTRTRPGTDRRPLIAYLRVQQDRERQMLSILQAASSKMDGELRRLAARSGLGAAVRADQIAASQAALHREMSALWRAVGDTVEAGRAEAAAAAVGSMFPMDRLRSVMPGADADYLMRSAMESARRGAQTVEARVGLSQIPLASSVYKNEQLANGTIDSIVNSALARGASARELAADVRSYIRPDVRGGVSYAAMRLGRTELNNAFHAQQVQQGIKEPWTLGMKWNLSGSHPRPDECNEYADSTHYEGGEAGVYRPEEVPAKPHPNCLCFTTPEVDDREAFIRKFESGEYDTFLEQEFGLEPAEMIRLSPQRAVREYAWGMGDSGNLVYGDLNGALRAGQAPTGRAADVDQGLEKMFALAKPTTTTQKVYRAFPGRDQDLVNGIVAAARAGRVWTDRGYMSTTKDFDILEDFDNEGTGVIMNIRMPAGSKMVHVDDYLDEMDFRQDEYLLPKGTKFRFSNLRREEGRWVVDATPDTPGGTPIAQQRPAVKIADQIARLENSIRLERARGAKGNVAVKNAARKNVQRMTIELRKLKAKKQR